MAQELAWHRGAYQKNDDWTRPTVDLSQPNCCDMGMTAMLMLTRSMLHSMKATKQRLTIVNRRCHALGALATCIADRRSSLSATWSSA